MEAHLHRPVALLCLRQLCAVLKYFPLAGGDVSTMSPPNKRNMQTVSIVGSPVNGLANSAPSSVIFVNLLRETSWKPPLSC